jgi:hypothetical protein
VRVAGTVSILETGGSPSSYDFRITRDPLRDEYVSILISTGTYSIDDSIFMTPGDFSFFIGAVGTDASDGVHFDILLTIPEPSTALLMGVGLVALGVRRRA